MHRRKYDPTDPGGAFRVSGRYHRARDLYSPPDTFPALYTALTPETCLGELIRHLTPELLPRLNGFRLTELAVSISRVVDIRDPATIRLRIQDLTDDDSVERTREIGAAAVTLNAEGLLVPSATMLGDNLVLFPDNLSANSRIKAISSRDPRLNVERE